MTDPVGHGSLLDLFTRALEKHRYGLSMPAQVQRLLFVIVQLTYEGLRGSILLHSYHLSLRQQCQLSS